MGAISSQGLRKCSKELWGRYKSNMAISFEAWLGHVSTYIPFKILNKKIAFEMQWTRLRWTWRNNRWQSFNRSLLRGGWEDQNGVFWKCRRRHFHSYQGIWYEGMNIDYQWYKKKTKQSSNNPMQLMNSLAYQKNASLIIIIIQITDKLVSLLLYYRTD